MYITFDNIDVHPFNSGTMSSTPAKPAPTPTPSEWWVVFDYEVDMYQWTLKLLGVQHDVHIHNALLESHLLHTRILVDILTSRTNDDDDIKLSELLPGFTSPSVDELLTTYKNGFVGSDGKPADSPYKQLNKRLAHPDKIRSDSHNYWDVMHLLMPKIDAVLAEVKKLRKP